MTQRQTVLDRSLRGVAQSLIETFGKQVIIRKQVRTPRPGQGDVTSSSSTSQSVLAYVANRGTDYVGTTGNVEDSTLELWIDDVRLEWVPDVGDEVVLGTDPTTDPIYPIDTHEEVFSGELVAIHKIGFGL